MCVCVPDLFAWPGNHNVAVSTWRLSTARCIFIYLLTYMCEYRVFYERHKLSIDVAVKLAVKVFDFCGVLWQIIMQRPKEK